MKSWIEVSAERLASNFAVVQTAVGAEFEILGVIKANAYGHDAAICAPVLVEAGARWLGVGDLEEGARVRGALFDAGLRDRETRLVVMCGFEAQDAPGIVQEQLTAVIWTPAHVQWLEEAGARTGHRVPVHLEIDSGMARQGAAPGVELASVLDALRTAKFVRCEGVFSHLSSAEVVRSLETTKQVGRLGAALEQIAALGLMPEYVHLGNSSAAEECSTVDWIRDFASAEMSATALMRPGLALYGYLLPLETEAGALVQTALRSRLRPVATWKTRVIGVREIAAGETVGYGATFVSGEAKRLALLPVGYADGFRREASSGVGDGWVILAGRRAPVVGRVSMNLTVVDVSAHANPVRVGDEVVLLGEGVTAEDHARWAETIPYEILCGMRGHLGLV